MANAIGTGVNVPDFRHLPITVNLIQSRNLIYLALDKRVSMVEIRVEIEIEASAEKVWSIVSDIDNEPKFWKGTKNVRNISKNGDVIHREVTIAFRDQKCLQKVTMYPKERIEVKFTKGIMDGKKTVTIASRGEKMVLETYWDIRLTGMMSMFTGMIKRHIKSGTEQAMQSIKKEIEG